jgi:hypothetical protein
MTASMDETPGALIPIGRLGPNNLGTTITDKVMAVLADIS